MSVAFSRLLLVAVITSVSGCAPTSPDRTEILWDTWGVPHIYARDRSELFYAFGWAQMASHGDLILRLYGEARGRGAEYWGEDHLDWDRWLHLARAPERARAWYEAQSPMFRGYLDAFVAGMNAYAREHPDRIADSMEVVLPLEPVDVLAHAQRIIHFTFGPGPWLFNRANNVLAGGSSAWAVGPSRTQDGHALLLANPHLGWGGNLVLYEAHLVAPDVKMYGATLVGLPVLAIAFNDRLGWTHTVNAIDPVDGYELTLADGGYLFDGEVRTFEEQVDKLLIRDASGVVREQESRSRWSVHGPVVALGDAKAVAVRSVGLDAPGSLEQWWEMGKARGLREFEAALQRQQIPLFAVIYADRDGHILHYFGGRVPVRPGGDFPDWWFNFVRPGDTSATLWTTIHSYDELPRVLDPPSGWLQNANDPPWTTSFPPVLDNEAYPSYVTPVPHFWARGQRSARILAQDSHITFDEFVNYKHSTRVGLADLILDDLVSAAQQHGGVLASRAAAVLDAWDRETDADSRGAVLFMHWARSVAGELQTQWGRREAPLFATPWRSDAPLSTPDGLSDPAKAVQLLEVAAREVERDFGALDVPWGEVYRLRGNGLDLPANGGPDPFGIFRTTFYRSEQGQYVGAGGDSYVAAVEFADPPRARVLLTYGNASQPHSRHRWDQLSLYARKELRDAWLTRADVEANLESRQLLNP